nr:hypothetical protein [Geobacteraceae bacterium]
MEFLQRLFIDPFNRFLDNVLLFLPNFLTAVVILIVGILIGAFLKMFFGRLFRAIGFDSICERTGMRHMLSKSGIKEPVSILVSRIIGGVTIAVFAVIAIQQTLRGDFAAGD